MTTEYRPATYENILDEMLARGAKPGQGGHLEGNAAEVSRAMIRLYASSMSFLFSEVVNVLGMEAAIGVVREATRAGSLERANVVRRELEGRGLPLDVEHMWNYWDGAEDEGAARKYNLHLSPDYLGFDVFHCAWCDQFRQLMPQPLAITFAEEMHEAFAQGINPDISVWYASLMERGEGKCAFRFAMTQEAARRAADQARQVREEAKKSGKPLAGEREMGEPDAAACHRSMARNLVIWLHFTVNELLRTIGDEQTEDILRRAMRKWGTWRGQMMAEAHQKRGWPLNVQNFITYNDDPAAGDAWVAENVTLTPTEHKKDITVSPYTKTFEWLGTGRFGAIMLEEELAAQAKAYNPSIEVNIAKLMERGDSISRLHYKMPS